MIDTHCHLTDLRLLEQLPQVLDRAAAAGVSRIITIGTGLADDEAAVAICHGRPNLRCVVGVHPNHSHEVELHELPRLREIQSDSAVVALGEMGLDYHYDFSPKARQRAVFEFQLSLAVEFNRPVVIHCRQATDDTLAILRGFPNVRALFHCFTGNTGEAKQILDQGYLIGFTGPVTYKKSDELRAAVRLVPLDRLVVETDAPYLTPEPMRKHKTNEPAFVMHTAAAVAKEKGIGLDELDRVTTANAERFFGWTGVGKFE